MKYYVISSSFDRTFCGGTVAQFQHAVKIYLNSWFCLQDGLVIDLLIFCCM